MRAPVQIAVGAGLAFLVLAMLVVTEWSPLIKLDQGAVEPTTEPSRDSELYRDSMKALTFALNSQLILLYTAVVAIALAAVRRYASAVWLAIVVGLGSALNPLLKQVFDRERPVVAEPVETFTGLSFPSGHANSAALVGLGLLVVFWARSSSAGRVALVTAAIVLPLFSGWTRLTLGGHFLSDIAGGALLALAWVAASAPLLWWLRRRLRELETTAARRGCDRRGGVAGPA